jgi:hypothetical protein
MSDPLQALGDAELRALAAALIGGRLAVPFTSVGVARLVGSDKAGVQERDIETGVIVRSAWFAASLANHFGALVEGGSLRRVDLAAVSPGTSHD